MSGFEPNAIIRGAQLTVVGAFRALQNPDLFRNEHYRQAALAVAAGIAIRLIIAIPVIGVRIALWIFSKFTNFRSGDQVVDSLDFIEHSVLQLPLFLVTMMKYITPAMDNMFMDSLRWVDETYAQKHQADDPHKLKAMYYLNMQLYSTHGDIRSKKKPMDALYKIALRYGRRAGISLAIYMLSLLPIVGRLVLPAASFYTFHNAVGMAPAVAIFSVGVLFPKRYFVIFLQSYFSSRALMRELLEPYFSRIRYTKEQKRRWFRDREGVLFGFALGFFLFLKIPLLGVLIYGIAEASTAYLITKITDPPPPPAEAENFPETQVRWKNKHEFLKLDLNHLDTLNTVTSSLRGTPLRTELKGKQFT